MGTRATIPPAERETAYKQILKDLAPMIKKHGERTIRWALNRWVTTERKRASLLATKREAEKELAKLS